MEWTRLAAEQGHPTSQFELGSMYVRAIGVEQDYKQAMKWWRLAAQQGHVTAQHNVGVMYAVGDGIGRDEVRALVWFELAAENVKDRPCIDCDPNGRRDDLRSRLTPADVAKAQEMARRCKSSNYLECD
jgi:TPR repeat protein